MDVVQELFGGYDSDDSYVIKPVNVRRTMAKGEVRRLLMGCELDVFTFCLYHGKFVSFCEEDKCSDKCILPNGVDLDRWEAAQDRARVMRARCAELDPRAKIALLRKRIKGAKVRIKFGR